MTNRHNLLNGPEPAEFRQKLKIIIVFIFIALGILLTRLWYLQIIKGDELSKDRKIIPFAFVKLRLCVV